MNVMNPLYWLTCPVEIESERFYFFNYFHLGLDFLLKESSHLVAKIILHSNLPRRPDFGRYHKCAFEIVLESKEERGIDTDMYWSQIQEELLKNDGKVLSGGTKCDHASVSSFYCFKNCIFEVAGNERVASTTLIL
jgi:hypothetical protein